MEESESQLQEYFINLLVDNGYEYVEIKNERQLISNFENQLKIFNNGVDFDFNEVIDYLSQGDSNCKFDKLRNNFKGVSFIDFSDFSSNIFQVSEEISMSGDYYNRYDVTLLINGLPLVQIELKKPGVELIHAFNQIQRYNSHSYSGLFDLIQIFIISNKINTKYFFNNSNFKYNLTYNWKNNQDIESFTNSFLIKNNLMKILSNYIFKDSISDKYLMLRDYQINALESVYTNIDNNKNAYVWMSNNTGRSTTSFRLAELLKDNYNVIYITKDLLSKYPSSLTVKSKKEFLKAVDNQNLIVSTIKIILALDEDESKELRDNEFIFIFNEYEKHSQKYSPLNLMKLFKNSLFYCFTSTPIFDENIEFDRTTKSIFNNRIETYSFKDALLDKINLPIDVEYVDDENIDENYNLSSKKRIQEISNYIIKNHSKKTHNRMFVSMLIASSNTDLIMYYENLKNSDLSVVPILRLESNDIFESKPIRDYFEDYILEYNDNFNSDIVHRKTVDTRGISREFEEDVLQKFRNDEIDLLLVDESMFTNEFRVNILPNLKKDLLNTVYLDSNLNYGSLFEALTMVNLGGCKQKTQGNIVLFRDLRENIKKTIKLFSDNNSSETYVFKDSDYYLNGYNNLLTSLDDSNNFINDFKILSNYYEILNSFDDFEFTKEQYDEFNFLKDKFEGEKYTFESNKKVISKFNLDLIDQFSIDLNYLDKKDTNSEEISQEITENNLIFETTNNNLNISNTDKSVRLNVLNNNQNLSKTINVKNEYHIHIGGDNIQNKNNFNENLDLKELIHSNVDKTDDEYVKICPKCHEKYGEGDNFCSKHKEEAVSLVYIHDLIKICKKCGWKYPKEDNYCSKCGSDEPLSIEVMNIETYPNKYYNFYTYSNRYGEVQDLLSQTNIEKLINFEVSQEDFNNIIDNIKKTSKTILSYVIDEYNINLDSLDVLDKIFLYSKCFVKTEYKDGGGDLGHFEFNEIFIDDRATNAHQITTLIHELSHFLLAEILEQIVSLLLNTDKTDAVEAFVCYNLSNDELNYLVDEYCAHTVDGRFALYGYQDYGSYNNVLSRFKQVYGEDYIDVANGIGNTFAYYIKDIMSSYIDKDLRKEIKMEFSKINDLPEYSGLQNETDELFDWQRFSKSIQIMLTSKIDDLKENPQDMENLKRYAIKFKKNNEG